MSDGPAVQESSAHSAPRRIHSGVQILQKVRYPPIYKPLSLNLAGRACGVYLIVCLHTSHSLGVTRVAHTRSDSEARVVRPCTKMLHLQYSTNVNSLWGVAKNKS